MRLILVDICREHTMIHRIDVTKGVYERPLYAKGSIEKIVEQVIGFMLKDRPDKIVIDKAYVGHIFEDVLKEELSVKRMYYNIRIDDYGNINYGE